MATIAELGQKVKAKYPGQYDDLDDASVGRKVQAKFPGQYDDFTEESSQPNQPSWLDRYLNVGPGLFKSVDEFGNSIRDLGYSSQPWSQRLGNVVSNIPIVGQPLTESAHALNRIIGIEPQVEGGSTTRDVLRALPGGSLVQDPFEEMASGQVPEGLRDLTMLGAGLYSRPLSARYGEPIQPVDEGLKNIWNPKTKQFEPPPPVGPGGTMGHAVRAAAPDVVQGAAKLGGGLVVSHFLPHWAQAMMGYPEYAGAKQIGEGLSKGYEAFKPLPSDSRMMNVTPFDLGAPEMPSAITPWQPPTLATTDVGIPQTVTPRGAAPGGIWNQPAPAPSPVRWTPPPEYQGIIPTPLTPPEPVEPIPATATPRGAVPGGPHNIKPAPGEPGGPAPPPLSRSQVLPVWANVRESQAVVPGLVEPIPATATPRGAVVGGIQNQVSPTPPLRITGGGARFEPSPAPDLSPVQPIPAAATPSGRTVPTKAERIARASAPIEPTVMVNVDTPTGVKAVNVPASAVSSPTPVVAHSPRAVALTNKTPLPQVADVAAPVAPAPAAAPPSGILQNLIKTVQASPDTNAETIAENAGNTGHGLTTSKNAIMANHLIGQGLTPEAWDALSMNDKNAWVKKINAATNNKYKPFGADYRPGKGFGRPAEEGARQVGDAMRVLGAKPPQ